MLETPADPQTGASIVARTGHSLRMDSTTVSGYLRRLGLDDPGAPSAAALAEIHRAQVERIAYNTVDIHLGRRTSVNPYASARRVVATGRGGYCFHLNGAFAALLGALGYDVRLHRASVWKGSSEVRLGPSPRHLALTVHGLPTDDNSGGGWLVDVGLGDALHEPMPLRVGEVGQGPFSYGLERPAVLGGGWRFRHDPTGSFGGMDFEAELGWPGDFVDSHTFLSTSPTSSFVRWIIVQRRDAAGVDRLVSCTLSRTEGCRTTERSLLSAGEWFAALADLFFLTLDDIDTAGRLRLWERALSAQRAWEAGQE